MKAKQRRQARDDEPAQNQDRDEKARRISVFPVSSRLPRLAISGAERLRELPAHSGIVLAINSAAAEYGPGGRPVTRFIMVFLDDANARVPVAVIDAPCLRQRQVTVVEGGIDLPRTVVIGMNFKRSHRPLP